MTAFIRGICERKAKAPGNPGDPIVFVASSPGVKRDGRDLEIANWDLENYRKNPVFLWVHDYMGRNLPIGRAEVTLEGKEMMAAVIFDQADEFARTVEGKYRRLFLNAVSVGWDDHVYCKKCGEELDRWSTFGLEYLRRKCPHCEADLTADTINLRYELLDISGVPVPGDQDALKEWEYRALKQIFEEDAPEEEGAEGEWRELAAKMVDVFTRAPDESTESRLRRYSGLLPKYRRLEKTPPEFRTNEELAGLGEEEIRGLFFHGEADNLYWMPKIGERVGAMLNARNRGDLEQAVTLIQAVLERARKEAEQEETGQEEERSAESGAGEVDETELVLQALRARMTFINLGG